MKNKKDVIQLLEKIALYMELKGENAFKISAYRKAAQSLERDERSLSEIKDFTKIKGIGMGTNTVITEYIENDTSTTLTELEEEIPEGLIPLLSLPGLGGKRIAKLYQELGVNDHLSLKKACENGQVEKLSGFGKKTAANILSALENDMQRPARIPIAIMLPIAEDIENFLQTIPEIKSFSLAGSLRRMRETIKDIDFIIATDQSEETRSCLLKMPNVKEIIAKGETKVSVVVEATYDIEVDFRLVKPEEFASTLHHFTGSKEHNVEMRQLAKSRGEKINEYGIINESTNQHVTFTSEKEFFQHFNLHYIPPELRESNGELEAFAEENVPLVELEHIRGDLHMHTTWSDGAHSVEEMVKQAERKGYTYIAITDHSKFLQVANGLNETRLRRQKEEINQLNEQYPDIHILAGVEMDILPDGDLDFSNEFLREMDLVIGAIHSGFNQSQDQIMTRLDTALDNPYVDIVAHPTGRIIGRRNGYEVNMEKLIERAHETNTVLEINANPNRLDLSAKWASFAQENRVKVAINTDAHNYHILDHINYGVRVARKGWLEKETVMNTWSKEKLIQYLNRNR